MVVGNALFYGAYAAQNKLPKNLESLIFPSETSSRVNTIWLFRRKKLNLDAPHSFLFG